MADKPMSAEEFANKLMDAVHNGEMTRRYPLSELSKMVTAYTESIRREAKREMREAAMERVPKGYLRIEAFENRKEIVIPEQAGLLLPSDHNCDKMGCGSLDHVFARFTLPIDTPPAAAMEDEIRCARCGATAFDHEELSDTACSEFKQPAAPEAVCPRCVGDGWISWRPKGECPDCHGTGKEKPDAK
jgi:hypothetical protein